MRKYVSILLLASLLPAASPAAGPREELLRLVPDSVGFCVVIQDLRGQADALRDSPFLQQLRQSPVGVKIRAGDDLKKLDRIESKMKDKLGFDWKRLREDILGDALVLAYRPGPPGKPGQEQGVLLLRARNEKVLVELIESINKVQKDEGELKTVEQCRHKDVVYYRRLEHVKRAEGDKPSTFYYLHGPILAVSPQEDMIRQIIDLDYIQVANAVPESVRRLSELDAERALLAVWVNPRAFDAELNAKIAAAPVERLTAVKQFALYWKALESVVVSFSPAEREVHLSLGVRARTEALPPAARRLFEAATIPSETWRRFPDSALLAAGGRVDGTALLEAIGGFLTPQQRERLHAALNRQFQALLGEENFVGEVMPALGPDWGLCVRAPAASDKNWLPRSLFALRVDDKRSKRPIEPKLLGLLDFAARLLVFLHNGQKTERLLSLKTGEVNGREVRYLTGNLPSGFQPSYGLLNGYLVVSSSLDEIKSFAHTAPSAAPSSGGSVPLLRVSFKDWRGYVKQRREPIVQFLADHCSSSREEVAQGVDGFLAGLQFIDRLELRRRAAPGQIVLTLSLQSTHSLKK